VNEDAQALQTAACCDGMLRESHVAFATVIIHTLFTCLRAFVWRIRVRGVRRARFTSAWTRRRSTCRARFARTWEAQTDKNVQNNYIDLPTTTTQYYSARYTLRAAVVASQQLLQAPRSPDPPAKALLANTHTMSLERRKPHQHDAPPSWIDPTLSWDGCPRAPAVESHLPRTTAPTQVQICPENPGRKARREDGVERHQAIGGREAALLRRTPGNLRLPEAMKTSRVGHGHGKPAFWPSGVRSGLQTAARTFEHVRGAHQVDTKTRGLNPKCATVTRCGII